MGLGQRMSAVAALAFGAMVKTVKRVMLQSTRPITAGVTM
jgi:hypothetical protein